VLYPLSYGRVGRASASLPTNVSYLFFENERLRNGSPLFPLHVIQELDGKPIRVSLKRRLGHKTAHR
jgi:hypothetical protein